MSVQVKQLTKIYGSQKAVDGVSFDIPEGAIVGLLGPNGAGKSTTMKILTGFIPQTSGKASVHGFDVETDSLEIRRLTGYLPESNPLYLDMYVQEYLHFVSGFYKVAEPAKRVKQMLEMTGLAVEQHKKNWPIVKRLSSTRGFSTGHVARPQSTDFRRANFWPGSESVSRHQVLDQRNRQIENHYFEYTHHAGG
jgi:ABC-2 type transport system ATP-binding protein